MKGPVRFQFRFGGRNVRSPIARALMALMGVVVVAGVIALGLLVALPLAALALAAALIGGVAAAFLPGRRRQRQSAPQQSVPSARKPGTPQRVEPVEPPRTLS